MGQPGWRAIAMLTFLLLYTYTLGVCAALICISTWSAYKGEHGIERIFAVGALLLCGLALSGLVGAPFDCVKVVIVAVILEFSFSGVLLALHSLVRTGKHND
jgi:hypothetical protein